MTETYYITSNDKLNIYLNKIRDEARIGNYFYIGVDLEFIEYKKNHHWVNKASHTSCILQLYSGKSCLVINLKSVCSQDKQLPKSLIKVLTKPSWVKVGLGLNGDMSLIAKNFGLGFFPSVIDVMCFTSMFRIKNPSLGSLYETYFGVVEKNGTGLYDWSKDDISEKKIVYAAKDAVMSRNLYLAMLEPTFRELKKHQVPQKIEININSGVLEEILKEVEESFEDGGFEDSGVSGGSDFWGNLAKDETPDDESFGGIENLNLGGTLTKSLSQSFKSLDEAFAKKRGVVMKKVQVTEKNWISIFNEYLQQSTTKIKLKIGYIQKTFGSISFKCVCIFGKLRIESNFYASKKPAKKEVFKMLCQKVIPKD